MSNTKLNLPQSHCATSFTAKQLQLPQGNLTCPSEQAPFGHSAMHYIKYCHMWLCRYPLSFLTISMPLKYLHRLAKHPFAGYTPSRPLYYHSRMKKTRYIYLFEYWNNHSPFHFPATQRIWQAPKDILDEDTKQPIHNLYSLPHQKFIYINICFPPFNSPRTGRKRKKRSQNN